MESTNFRLACGLYEQVELWSMRRTNIVVEYKNADKSIEKLKGIITDVYVKNKVEFVQVNKDIDIETSNIVSINAEVSFLAGTV